jgi:hypothetical protein
MRRWPGAAAFATRRHDTTTSKIRHHGLLRTHAFGFGIWRVAQMTTPATACERRRRF